MASLEGFLFLESILRTNPLSKSWWARSFIRRRKFVYEFWMNKNGKEYRVHLSIRPWNIMFHKISCYCIIKYFAPFARSLKQSFSNNTYLYICIYGSLQLARNVETLSEVFNYVNTCTCICNVVFANFSFELLVICYNNERP